MTWAQRLKRVFDIDIKTYSECGGAVKVIACIEDPQVINKILDHLRGKAGTKETSSLPEGWAPLMCLFDSRSCRCTRQETVFIHNRLTKSDTVFLTVFNIIFLLYFLFLTLSVWALGEAWK